MDVCSRISPWLLGLLLQAARMGCAEGAAHERLSRHADDSVTFSLDTLPGTNFSNLIWRSSSRGPIHVVAAWEAGNIVDVLNANYARRVTFHEESWSLEIHNLTKEDGGFYEAVELQGDSEVLLKQYTLFVFDFSVEESKSVNGSCILRLRCEAGVGAGNKVTYSWTSGGVETQGSGLHLTLRPADKNQLAICGAVAAEAHQEFSIFPFKYCPVGSRAAGLLAPPSLGILLLLLLLLPRL
ncbi:SLAM family member 9 isoform X1 [Sphaerodactylus townsendi]|uniref:SLAM family member 9 isoform X1 n=1 Tax=Sphaerodactylus townsendi TaxID=933632 RepID=UPI002025EEB1|nr:SLAM family member 9 isoform X1 [Sphaerodactylus townsendi]